MSTSTWPSYILYGHPSSARDLKPNSRVGSQIPIPESVISPIPGLDRCNYSVFYSLHS
jgi:hypothetical protein